MIPDEKALRELLKQLTIDEKITFLYGDGKVSTHAVPRLGIGSVMMDDGPRGIRLEDGRTSTALPCGIALACSFSREAAYAYGQVLGEETRAAGYQAILGPGLNLMRTPLCGRNFEYSGEDPVLAGKLCSAYIKGVQSTGVAACPKHFALNNQETCRRISSSNIDERTLRELYLRGFEILVKDSTPWMLMSSYNRINQIYASEHRHLQQEILKDEWGFDGVVVSDWGATHSSYRAAVGGLDLEMAGGEGAYFNKKLRRLVELGLVSESVIDDKVMRILRLVARTGRLTNDAPKQDAVISTQAHRTAAKKLAQSCTVLLKNEKILPLDKAKIKRLAVVGPSADYRHDIGMLFMCGGSGAVHPEYEITPLAGLKEYLGKDVQIDYFPGDEFTLTRIIPGDLLQSADGKKGLHADYFATHAELDDPAAKPLWSNQIESFDMRWGNMSNWVALETENTPIDHVAFGGRLTGFLVPEKDGKGELAIFQGGASHTRLYLDGKLLIDNLDPKFMNGKSTFAFEGKKGVPIPIELRIEKSWADSQLSIRLLYFQENLLDEKAIRDADAVLYFGGTNHTYDKEAVGCVDLSAMADIPDLELPGKQNDVIRRLAELNPKLVVTLIGGSVMNVEPWIDQVPAVLDAWYAGMEAGRALAELLFGDAEPGGRLACTWGKKLDDYLCHQLELVPGLTDPYCAMTDYLDKLLIGYRHFDKAKIEPRFAFGFGLSYTTFDYQVKNVDVAAGKVTAQVEVVNTGKRSGSAVVQLYIAPIDSAVERPLQELGDFAKIELAPGERAMVSLELVNRDFAYFSESENKFVVAPGKYALRFGTSSRAIFDERVIER